MNIDYSEIIKVTPFNNQKKQKIIVIDNLLKKECVNEILKSLKKSLLVSTKVFKHNNKIIKTEYNNINKLDKNFLNLYKELYSRRFLDILSKIFNIKKLYPDGNKLYSGINVSNINSVLKEHIDFNFNSKLKKYRVINLLLYFNKNYQPKDGGKFYYRDSKSEKRKYINPTLNKAVIFVTNKYVPHGFTKVKKKRISLNLYYYTNKNYSLTNKKHKTIWI